MRSGSGLYFRLLIVGMAATGCLQLCGCHQTVLVYGPSALPAPPVLAGDPNSIEAAKVKAAKNKLPGIPFYNHYGVCTQEMVWLEPQTTLSFTVKADGEKPVTRTMTLNKVAFHDQSPQGHDVNSLVTSLTEAGGDHTIADQDKKFCPANVAAGWDAVRDYDSYKVKPIDESADTIK